MAKMTIKEAIKWQEAFKKTYRSFPGEVDSACDMAIDALKAYESVPKKRFILCETIEREISEPVFFDNYEDAYREMKERCFEAAGIEDREDMDRDELFNEQYADGTGEISEWYAYCENANHDNCDWKIFENGVKEEHKQQKNTDKGFILTDNDSFQLCKKIKDNVFELYQITKVLPFTDVEKCYQVSHEVIDVNNVDVDSLCKIFYYHGRVRELEEEYGADWPQIVAEMAFEENAFQNLIDDEEMTYEDAKSLIKQLSGFNE